MTGIPIGLALLYILIPLAFRDQGDYVLKIIFFGPLFVLFMGMVCLGIFYQFATITLSKDGLIYRGLGREKKIAWGEVARIKCPLSAGPRGGFTSYASITKKDGKVLLIPCGGGIFKKSLVAILNNSKTLEKLQANNTLDTNSSGELC